MYVAACFFVFATMYSLIIVTTSIGYHRGLAHGSVRIHPFFRSLLLGLGNWLTGVDPKGWVVMHRLHHIHSDTPDDPHSPQNVGIAGIFPIQFVSYYKALRGLRLNQERYASVARDLDYPVSWPIRSGLFFLPHLLHAGIAIMVGLSTGMWLLGGAYFAGIMSHSVQGAFVNWLGHAVGSRNFELPDESRNNQVAAWLILGEGLQNNHHRYPSSARFSYRWPEVDPGYAVCRVLEGIGVLRIVRGKLIRAA